MPPLDIMVDQPGAAATCNSRDTFSSAISGASVTFHSQDSALRGSLMAARAVVADTPQVSEHKAFGTVPCCAHTYQVVQRDDLGLC